MPVVVKAKRDDSNDDVIRRFKKQVIQDQVLTETRKHEFYKKPSRLKQEKRKELEHRKKILEKYGS